MPAGQTAYAAYPSAVMYQEPIAGKTKGWKPVQHLIWSVAFSSTSGPFIVELGPDSGEHTKGWKMLKRFLILTGASFVGFFVSIVLHNVVYGALIHFFGADFWERTGIGDEPVFFLIALVICPIGFVVGVVGTIVQLIKRRRAVAKS